MEKAGLLTLRHPGLEGDRSSLQATAKPLDAGSETILFLSLISRDTVMSLPGGGQLAMWVD